MHTERLIGHTTYFVEMKLLWSFLPLPVFSITKHGLGLCDLEWNAFHLISNVCMWSLFKLSTAGANMTTLMMMIYIYILFPLWLLVLPSSTWILASLFSLQWWPSAIQFNFCLSLHFTVLCLVLFHFKILFYHMGDKAAERSSAGMVVIGFRVAQILVQRCMWRVLNRPDVLIHG